MNFKDHFSTQAVDYAKFRPQYPRKLFQFIASVAPNDKLALDVATGNGQAAGALTEFFDRVIGIDASANQIASAQPHDRVEYRVAPAESTNLPGKSCDAATVAQALHWFDLKAFYTEMRRVLVPGGVLAIWAYNYLQISPEVDAVVRRFHDEVVGTYWPPERKLVGRPYLDLPFPFPEVPSPGFAIEVRWSLDQLLGYLGTWSATQRFRVDKHRDPLELITQALAEAWGDRRIERLASWLLTTRIGRLTNVTS